MISIIIPVYNAEKYLGKCLDSILNQTYSDFEIIIVNDGSSDSSDSICKKYMLDEPRIQYIIQKNQGVSAARNTGIKRAKGEYLLFVDADDTIDSLMLKKMLESIEDKKSDMVYVGFEVLGNNLRNNDTQNLEECFEKKHGVMTNKEAIEHTITTIENKVFFGYE